MRWVYIRQILQNFTGRLLVQLTVNFSSTILFGQPLSFVGFGIRPPPTLRGQILGGGQNYLINARWLAVVPGLTVLIVRYL